MEPSSIHHTCLTSKASRRLLLAATAVLLALGAHAAWLQVRVQQMQEATWPHDIKRAMAWKQRYLDKAWYAAQAEDWRTVDWYLSQLEKLAEALAQADIRNGNGPISELEAKMLLPALAPIYPAIEARDALAFDRQYRAVVGACNACHVATQHAYLQIAVPNEGAGPWNQRFGPQAQP